MERNTPGKLQQMTIDRMHLHQISVVDVVTVTMLC
jgi:hypothetical protein